MAKIDIHALHLTVQQSICGDVCRVIRILVSTDSDAEANNT